ncbi:MAG TPA: 2-oxoacid:acceptor oxidoreductase family protein [Nitrospiria bacterium]|nr:2-oxoacid:acceptor oxidoreductase family protein [Nitrospiria bacterium]
MRFNIRMAGVGGQGVVTASHVFSTAVINAGGESTIVPFYGSEKRMAPVESYVRVSSDKIYEIGEIMFPHIIMVFHPQVITHGKSYTMPFHFGIKDGGTILVNSKEEIPLPGDEMADLVGRGVQFRYLAATQMALDVAGTDLATNMAMVGAISGITGLTTREAVAQAVKERFLGKGFVVSGGTASLDSVVERKFKHKQELLEKNIAAVNAAWDYAEAHNWQMGKQAQKAVPAQAGRK